VVPFVADSFMGILANHVHTEPLDPRQAAPDRPIPTAVAAICTALLGQDAHARPSAEAVANQVRELIVREGAAIAAVMTGPRAGVAGPSVDTHVLHEEEGELPIAERPTCAPVDRADAHDLRSATRIGHALAASTTSQVVRVDSP